MEKNDEILDSTDISQENAESFEAESSTTSQELEAESSEDSTKIKELEDKYMRAYAEFENVKKRMEREKAQVLEYANEGILKDFLPILDTLEAALNGISETEEFGLDSSQDNNFGENLKNIKQGIVLTIESFHKAFGKHSVEVIDCSGEFDPNFHNAIMQVKDESKADGAIAQVIQKGYKYKDRVIRPAMVSITKNN